MTENADGDKQLSLLLWLTGCCDEPVASLDMEEDALFALLQQHRVVGRALQTLLREKPVWATVTLLKMLQERHQQLIEQASKQIAVVAEFSKKFNVNRTPLIILKGLTAYAHSLNRYHIRESSDIDFIMKDPTETIHAVKNHRLDEFRKVSPHEYLNVTVNGVEMDLHAFYPIWYCLDGDEENNTKIHGDGIAVIHDKALQVGQLRVEDILENALVDVFSGAENVFYADAAAASIILCAHAHRDFISKSSVTARKKPPVRFSEITELIDYFRSTDFDHARFLHLMSKTNASQSVLWMCHVVRKVTGITLLQELPVNLNNKYPEADFLSQQLVWSGFWSTFHRSSNAEIFRHLTDAETVNALGCCRVNMQQGEADIVVSSEKISGAEAGAVIHIRAAGCPDACFVFSLQDGQLEINSTIASSEDCMSRRLYIDIFDQPLEFQSHSSGSYYKKSLHFPDHQFDYKVMKTSYTCRLKLHLAPYLRTVSLLIAVGEFEDAYYVRRGMLLPVELCF
ncbi:nucleotidyltransferase family protein [Pectobacterium punjabense]|uniref:nucleotidyltransferase family protein n=1 Tax=Pectobacterium punjabense TaxID=2108399 RepID=UPI002405C31B|nr:nucleotidyltransferase family protein [Pectobacterium punjabense]MDG0796061.1 nucleotidyltransferase family protein [Pectobacterium punjabense]